MKNLTEFIQKHQIKKFEFNKNVEIRVKTPIINDILKIFDLNCQQLEETCNNSDKLWDILTKEALNIYDVGIEEEFEKAGNTIFALGNFWFIGDVSDDFDEFSIDFNVLFG